MVMVTARPQGAAHVTSTLPLDHDVIQQAQHRQRVDHVPGENTHNNNNNNNNKKNKSKSVVNSS